MELTLNKIKRYNCPLPVFCVRKDNIKGVIFSISNYFGTEIFLKFYQKVKICYNNDKNITSKLNSLRSSVLLIGENAIFDIYPSFGKNKIILFIKGCKEIVLSTGEINHKQISLYIENNEEDDIYKNRIKNIKGVKNIDNKSLDFILKNESNQEMRIIGITYSNKKNKINNFLTLNVNLNPNSKKHFKMEELFYISVVSREKENKFRNQLKKKKSLMNIFKKDSLKKDSLKKKNNSIMNLKRSNSMIDLNFYNFKKIYSNSYYYITKEKEYDCIPRLSFYSPLYK